MKHVKKSDERLQNAGRRLLFKAVGFAGAVIGAGQASVLAASAKDDPDQSQDGTSVYVFLQPDEAAFIRAAAARLIPGTADAPGAEQADVTNFIDKALSSPWGSGSDMYVSGPWQSGTPQQGYQLKFTPAELYRTALGAINRNLEEAGTPFPDMTDAKKDAYLSSLETGDDDLDGVPSAVFFTMLLQNTVEGYLADPIYGGNRNMVGWKAIGFPGAYASWYDLADKHGIDLSERTSNPTSIADAPKHVAHSNKKG